MPALEPGAFEFIRVRLEPLVLAKTVNMLRDVRLVDETVGRKALRILHRYFRAGRTAGNMAWKHAGITDPLNELDFVELHDAYTSSEIQTYEDLGLCRYGEGGPFAESGKAFLPNIDYGLQLRDKPACAVNPSGGLIACGHPVGATGLMQGVFALWQLQGTIDKHFGDGTLQIANAKKGAIHSHAGTGTYVTVSILEKGQ